MTVNPAEARLRVLYDEAARRNYCIVVSPDTSGPGGPPAPTPIPGSPGTFTARAYALGREFTNDIAESRPSALEAVEAVVERLKKGA